MRKYARKTAKKCLSIFVQTLENGGDEVHLKDRFKLIKVEEIVQLNQPSMGNRLKAQYRSSTMSGWNEGVLPLLNCYMQLIAKSESKFCTQWESICFLSLNY